MISPSHRFRRALVLASAALLAACASSAPAPPDPAYVEEIETWRAEREARLRSEDGWLTLVGLYWLEPGENTFGHGEDNHVVLPEGRGPERAGTFLVDDAGVTLVAEPGSGVTLDGEPVVERVLAGDDSEAPDVLELDGLRFYVIRRGDRWAVRVKDPQSPSRAEFQGLDYFPIDPAYRAEARWVTYDEPKTFEVATAVGTVETMLVPGYAEFTVEDETVTLVPMLQSPDDESWFFIFRDATSGTQTYGAGRYLYADAPRDGTLVLDFNKAYNPPCVFTPYATCPLPPRENWLEVAIEAGEKDYGHHGP